MAFLKPRSDKPPGERAFSEENRTPEERLRAMNSLDHVGIAVRSVASVMPAYKAIGLRVESVEEVLSEGVRTTFLGGGSHIELLEALTPESPIASFLEKRGEGIHHVAVAVWDIDAALDRARKEGLQVVGKAPRPGARGRRVAFFHPNSLHGVLLEIVESPRAARRPR